MTKQDMLFYSVAAAFGAALAYTIPLIFLFTPTAQDAAGGLAQKIFYFHAGVADAIYVTGGVCFAASAVYLVSPSETANSWARAGAECAALFGTLVLCSGPFWAKKAWGVYWVWDPQLTTLLLSVLVYFSICILRSFAGEGAAERRFAAALGVMGTVNLPIIYFSVRQWGGNHPTVTRAGGGGMDRSMWWAFAMGQLTLTLLLPPLLLWLRSQLHLLDAELSYEWQEAMLSGIVEGADDFAEDSTSAVQRNEES